MAPSRSTRPAATPRSSDGTTPSPARAPRPEEIQTRSSGHGHRAQLATPHRSGRPSGGNIRTDEDE